MEEYVGPVKECCDARVVTVKLEFTVAPALDPEAVIVAMVESDVTPLYP